MADPYYDPASEPKSTPEPPETDAEGEDDGEKSALLPKSLFGEVPKPGDRVSMDVIHVYEDEVEVGPVKAKEAPADESGEARLGRMWAPAGMGMGIGMGG